MEIRFFAGQIGTTVQRIISQGFERHSLENDAPRYKKERFNWLSYTDSGVLIGVLTADHMWDWMYIDELWVAPSSRGTGIGTSLLESAEDYAVSLNMSGIWLWTQSWQAPQFYKKLGYREFTRFNNFPKGHSRIGFRKELYAKR